MSNENTTDPKINVVIKIIIPVLLLLYSIGHSFLVLIAGTSVGFVHKLSSSEKYGGASKILRIVMGIIIMIIAFYMFYLGF